jgi:hypothetical protein
MKKFLMLVLFLSGIFSREASASPSNQFIAENFQKIFSVAPSCQSKLKEFLKLQDSYETAYKAVLKGESSDTPKEILMQLAQTLSKQETTDLVCFRHLSAAYAASVFQSESRIETQPQDALFLMFLYKEGILQPLSKTTRRDLGGLWAKKESNGYVLYGAYDCERTRIYFDPYKAPGDLRGALEHELDHFYRDKLVRWNPRESSAISFLIADEIRATVYGSAAAAQPLIAYVNNDQTLHHREFNSRYRYFDDIDFDFNLFDRHGILGGLAAQWDWLGPDWMESPGAGPDSLTLLRSVMSEPQVADRVDQMIEKIAVGYFGKDGQSVNKAEIRKILAKGDSDLRSFFQHVMRIPDTRPIDYTTRAALLKKMSHIYDGPMQDLKTVWPLFAKALLEIRAQSKSPSPICKAIDQAMTAGQLKNYLGTGIGVPADTVKPGSEGVKPGSEGVKPGSEGVKPGSEGVKPGSEGVKPSVEIRPCLSLGTGF